MTRNFAIIALIAVLISSLPGCSKRDNLVSVEEDDVEMNAAIADARQTLPQFWQVFERPEKGESDFALKVKITDKHGTGFFWATDITRNNGKVMGTINNDPDIVKNVKLGDRIEIPEPDIADWLYMRDQKMFGNRTVRPLLKKISKTEADKIRSILAEP